MVRLMCGCILVQLPEPLQVNGLATLQDAIGKVGVAVRSAPARRWRNSIKKVLRGISGRCRLTPDWQLCAYRPMAWQGPLTRVLNVWVAPLTGATPFLLAQERCAKEGHPTSGFRFAQLPSLRCCSGGRLTWAIPGPLRLSPHPCGSSPYATPPLGLLTGSGRELARRPQDRTRRRLVFCLFSCAAIIQTTPISPSGGRVESPRKGLSDMDVARAAMGHGWPFAACPWSGGGRREPRRSRGRMSGCPSLWLLSLGQARESDSPVRGETRTLVRHVNEPVPEAESAVIRKHKLASPVSSPPSPQKCDEPKKGGLR